ncbi:TonB-dependent receptor domain-containing protein [candidate division KSB1 bacterium]
MGSGYYNPAQLGQKILPRAIGSEIGMRRKFGKMLNLGMSAWWIDLEEELIYIGDSGVTEIKGESRRKGIDIEGRAQIYRWMLVDLDISLSDGRLQNEPDGANYIPSAPRLTATGGLTVLDYKGLDGSLRFRSFGRRPLNENNSVSAEPYTLINFDAGYRLNSNIRLIFNINNLLAEDWYEAQYDSETRLYNEAEPVSELTWVPGNPRTFQIGLRFEF